MQSAHFADWPDPGPYRIVRIERDIDIATRAAFAQALADTPDARPLIVDLSYCPFLDSTGLSTLIRRHSHGSSMAIVLPKKCSVERVFSLTNMNSILNIFESLEEAEDALSRSID